MHPDHTRGSADKILKIAKNLCNEFLHLLLWVPVRIVARRTLTAWHHANA
jgi:hypothetical protein